MDASVKFLNPAAFRGAGGIKFKTDGLSKIGIGLISVFCVGCLSIFEQEQRNVTVIKIISNFIVEISFTRTSLKFDNIHKWILLLNIVT